MDISWNALNELEKEHRGSFYLLEPHKFADNYNEFLEAFRRYYPNSSIGYSYKTNYTPKLCQLVNQWGGYAEVVSGLEYALATRIGVPPSRIIFNGPYKKEAELEKALLAGSIVNLDSFYELELVERIAQRSPGHAMTVGIRCNFNIGKFDIGSNRFSRFGFDVEREDFGSVFETLDRLENCRVGGFHCHFSTRHRSVESYALRTKNLLEVTACYFGDRIPQFIDVGGGYFSKMSPDLRRQFDSHVPDYNDYAEAIGSQIADAYPNNSGPELILEPGLALTADIMKFVARVIDIKTIGSKRVALVSGTIHNIKQQTSSHRNLPITVVRRSPANQEPQIGNAVTDIVGYTCMENDLLYLGYEGGLDVDDYVVFDNVGAYTLVMKPPFIRASPPVIMYNSASEEFEQIKRRAEFSDVFATYVF
jgi:diaminopimelate decarboxylase